MSEIEKKQNSTAPKKNDLFELLEPIRKFTHRRALPISVVFFAASAALFLLVLLMVASMMGLWQSQVPISLGHLLLIGMHVCIFFSVGRKFRRIWVAASQEKGMG